MAQLDTEDIRVECIVTSVSGCKYTHPADLWDASKDAHAYRPLAAAAGGQPSSWRVGLQAVNGPEKYEAYFNRGAFVIASGEFEAQAKEARSQAIFNGINEHYLGSPNGDPRTALMYETTDENGKTVTKGREVVALIKCDPDTRDVIEIPWLYAPSTGISKTLRDFDPGIVALDANGLVTVQTAPPAPVAPVAPVPPAQ